MGKCNINLYKRNYRCKTNYTGYEGTYNASNMNNYYNNQYYQPIQIQAQSQLQAQPQILAQAQLQAQPKIQPHAQLYSQTPS